MGYFMFTIVEYFEYKKGEAKASPKNLKTGGQLTQERVKYLELKLYIAYKTYFAEN